MCGAVGMFMPYYWRDCMALKVASSVPCDADIQEILMTRSVLSLVNGRPWDMHKPLNEECELQFLHFKDNDPSLSNQVFKLISQMFYLLLYMITVMLLMVVAEQQFKAMDFHPVDLCYIPAETRGMYFSQPHPYPYI